MPIPTPTPAPKAAQMPAPAAMPEPTRFLNRLIRFLMPFFLSECPDAGTAQLEIIETLATYGARTRAELLNAAQIIAYGLSALDALHEAKTAEMSTSMRLRLRGCANNLNRSAQQNEQRLAKRLACDAPTTQPAELVDDISDADLEQHFQQIQAQLAAASRPLPVPPTTLPRPPAAKHATPEPRWSSAMMQAVADEVAAHAQTTSHVTPARPLTSGTP